MGIINYSKDGKISGKVGDIVAFVTKDGLHVVRAYVKPKNPKTPKQMAHRMKFALANKSLSPLQAVIKMGYPHKKNAYRGLVGKAYHEAIAGAYPDFWFDYGKLKVADGKLQLPENIRFEPNRVSREVTFRWDPRLADPTRPGSDGDKMVVVLFNSIRTSETSLISRFTRSQGVASVTVPADWELDATHFWIYLSTQDLRENSESVYFRAI